MSIFDKFEKSFDNEGIVKELEEMKKGQRDNQYKDVPFGIYEVSVHTLEPRIAKSSGLPMLTIAFKVLEGEYKGSLIWQNISLGTTRMIGNAIRILEMLTSESKEDLEVKYKTITQFENLMLDVFESIDTNFEYLYQYEKEIWKCKIKEVFTLED